MIYHPKSRSEILAGHWDEAFPQKSWEGIGVAVAETLKGIVLFFLVGTLLKTIEFAPESQWLVQMYGPYWNSPLNLRDMRQFSGVVYILHLMLKSCVAEKSWGITFKKVKIDGWARIPKKGRV